LATNTNPGLPNQALQIASMTPGSARVEHMAAALKEFLSQFPAVQHFSVCVLGGQGVVASSAAGFAELFA